MKIRHKQIVKNTLMNHYISEDRISLIGMMREDKVIYTNSNYKGEVKNGVLDYRNLKNEEIVEKSIEDNELLYKYLNIYKVQKSYKYSVIFNYESFDTEIFNDLISKNIIYKPDNNIIMLSKVISKPEIYKMNDKILLSFHLILKSKYIDDKELEIFYTIIAIFHENINTLEIRLDQVSNRFKNYGKNSEFYERNIKSIITWLENQINLKITCIDVESIANYIRKYKKEDIAVASVEMQNNHQTKTSMVAYIDKNGDYILPIIDELKIFVEENKELLEQIPELYKKFSLFIEQIEMTSTYPKIVLCWIKKGNDFKVDLLHNYEGEAYTLFKHLGRVKKMEGMTYVTEYLIKCKADSEKLREN